MKIERKYRKRMAIYSPQSEEIWELLAELSSNNSLATARRASQDQHWIRGFHTGQCTGRRNQIYYLKVRYKQWKVNIRNYVGSI